VGGHDKSGKAKALVGVAAGNVVCQEWRDIDTLHAIMLKPGMLSPGTLSPGMLTAGNAGAVPSQGAGLNSPRKREYLCMKVALNFGGAIGGASKRMTHLSGRN
jgi:hypothetical protein